MDFKYKSTFRSFANFAHKPTFQSNELVAKASLSDLKSLLPSDAEIEDNPDLLYTAFNVCVANLINANDDGVMTDTALAMAPYFKHKQGNIEHMRSYVVGHAINFGFSSFADSKPMTAEELAGTNLPFNLSLAAVVYKVVDEYFSEYLNDASDPSHYLYNNVATSWEIGFNEYMLCIGSKKIADAEIIEKDAQVAEFTKYLRAEGGSGFTKDGVPVYRIIMGSPRPLGWGFTSNPAAAVSGVLTSDAAKIKKEKEECAAEVIEQTPIVIAASKAEPEVVEEQETALIEENFEENEKNNKKSSQAQKTPVIKSNMKIESFEHLYDNWSEVEASAARSFVRDQLKEMNDKFVAEKDAKDKEISTAKAELDSALNDAKTAKAELEKVKDEVKQIREAQEAQAFEIAFNDRMASIEEVYELSDAQRKIVAKQVKQIGADAEFAAWLEDFKTLNAASLKSDEQEEEKEVVATKALDKVEKTKESIANAQEPSENKADKYRKAFAVGEGVTIEKRR